MKLEINQVDVWAASIEDKPGGLCQKFDTLAQAGVNMEFVIARRAAEKPGTGVVFVTPIKGARQINAARQAGFKKTKSMHSLRITGADKVGLAAQLTEAIADVGINLRGFSAAVIGKRVVLHLAFDSAGDANKALRRIKQI